MHLRGFEPKYQNKIESENSAKKKVYPKDEEISSKPKNNDTINR